MTQMPPTGMPPTTGSGYLQPHRGVMILVFGILSFFVCMIFGIVAWVMGNNDLRAMDEGRMDPEGRGLTQAGKICGMISVILTLVFIVLWIAMVALFGVLGAAGAAAN